MKNFPKPPVIILCGGRGSRFSKINQNPKQLSHLNGKPLIIHIIDHFFKSGFNYFILPLGFKKKMFTNFFKSNLNNKKFNLNIVSSHKQIIEKKKNILLFDAKENTNKLGRIKKSLKFINNAKLIVTYGDGISNVNVNSLLNFSKNSECTLTAYKIKSQYGHIELNKKNILKKFIEKPFMEKPINIGFYVFSKKLLENNYRKNIDLEDGLLPKLTKKIKILCYFHKGFFYSVDNPKDLEKLKKTYGKR